MYDNAWIWEKHECHRYRSQPITYVRTWTLISVTFQKGQGHKGQVNYVDWSAHEPYRLCHCCFYICHHFSSVRNSFIFFQKKTLIVSYNVIVEFDLHIVLDVDWCLFHTIRYSEQFILNTNWQGFSLFWFYNFCMCLLSICIHFKVVDFILWETSNQFMCSCFYRNSLLWLVNVTHHFVFYIIIFVELLFMSACFTLYFHFSWILPKVLKYVL